MGSEVRFSVQDVLGMLEDIITMAYPTDQRKVVELISNPDASPLAEVYIEVFKTVCDGQPWQLTSQQLLKVERYFARYGMESLFDWLHQLCAMNEGFSLETVSDREVMLLEWFTQRLLKKEAGKVLRELSDYFTAMENERFYDFLHRFLLQLMQRSLAPRKLPHEQLQKLETYLGHSGGFLIHTRGGQVVADCLRIALGVRYERFIFKDSFVEAYPRTALLVFRFLKASRSTEEDSWELGLEQLRKLSPHESWSDADRMRYHLSGLRFHRGRIRERPWRGLVHQGELLQHVSGLVQSVLSWQPAAHRESILGAVAPILTEISWQIGHQNNFSGLVRPLIEAFPDNLALNVADPIRWQEMGLGVFSASPPKQYRHGDLKQLRIFVNDYIAVHNLQMGPPVAALIKPLGTQQMMQFLDDWLTMALAAGGGAPDFESYEWRRLRVLADFMLKEDLVERSHTYWRRPQVFWLLICLEKVESAALLQSLSPEQWRAGFGQVQQALELPLSRARKNTLRKIALKAGDILERFDPELGKMLKQAIKPRPRVKSKKGSRIKTEDYHAK